MSSLTNKLPFFSVIICTYNRSDIIQRALDSLIGQQEKDWEGIIIDDGSEDNTKAVIAAYLKEYPIRYYRQTHAGLAPARNTGMEIATGKYITFLDTDDEYKPDHLKVRKTILEKDTAIDLLHSNVTIIGNPFVPDKNHPENKIHINNCVVGGTFCIKRNSLTTSDLFSNHFSDDSLFLEKWIKKGKNIRKINAPTYLYYRDLEDSLCNQPTD